MNRSASESLLRSRDSGSEERMVIQGLKHHLNDQEIVLRNYKDKERDNKKVRIVLQRKSAATSIESR
jgi:hypothetical protein